MKRLSLREAPWLGLLGVVGTLFATPTFGMDQLSTGPSASVLHGALPLGVLVWLLDNQEATVILVLAAFGLIQYRNERRWKKKEFAFHCIKEIKSDERYQSVVNSIAWDGFPVAREENDDDGVASRRVKPLAQAHLCKLIIDDLLLGPEASGEGVKDPLPSGDFYLLKNIDIYLTELDQFFHYVRSGLFNWADCHQYIGYTFDQYVEGLETLRELSGRRWRASSWAFHNEAKVLAGQLRENELGALLDHQKLVLAILLYAAHWQYSNFLEELDIYRAPSWLRSVERLIHSARRAVDGLKISM